MLLSCNLNRQYLSSTELNLMLCHTYKMDSHLTRIALEDQVAELFWVNVLSK